MDLVKAVVPSHKKVVVPADAVVHLPTVLAVPGLNPPDLSQTTPTTHGGAIKLGHSNTTGWHKKLRQATVSQWICR